ncbi:MAG TPA: cyclic nucleotide-binding domain-containing protein [Solirubrobacteraceae bacterium]|nr:cyclic nucleotide-binding domain-containing protein [Solirubrobacteraceae bacterium]
MSSRIDLSQFMDTSPDALALREAETMVFLDGVTEADWDRVVARCERRIFAEGETIWRVGELDRSLIIVSRGALALFLSEDDPEPHEIVPTQSVVGAISFFDGLGRAETVRGMVSGELLRLDFDDFEALSAEAPHLGQAILLDLGRIVALRLRRSAEKTV